jgi:hypothetical protein
MCIGLAKAVAIEFMFEKALNFRTQRPRGLKLWTLQDFSRALNGFGA